MVERLRHATVVPRMRRAVKGWTPRSPPLRLGYMRDPEDRKFVAYLLTCFDASELRRLVGYLPDGDAMSREVAIGDAVSSNVVVDSIVDVLRAHGLLSCEDGPAFWQSLERSRPRRTDEIRRWRAYYSTHPGKAKRESERDAQILIVRYAEGFGCMGDLEAIFACTRLEYDALLAWGRYDHGEVLGKHSDITGEFTAKTLTVLVDSSTSSADAAFVERARVLGIVGGGCPYRWGIEERASYGELHRLESLGPERLAKLAEMWCIRTEQDAATNVDDE